MSQVTRCPACGTVFRVVQDQLKVSEGWVRCGRCAEVFNAVEGLFDLDAEGAATGPGALPPPPPVEPPAPTLPPAPEAPAPPPPRPTPSPPPPTAAYEASAEAEALAAELQAVYAQAAQPEPSAAEAAAEPDALDNLRADEAPDFIRRADHAARWRHPARRTALALLALVLAATLAAQIALHYRDGLAAQWPAARPVLQQGCAWLGCRIEPPRRIEALSVDSSGLVRIEGSALYRLSLVLQNKSSVEVMAPAIDLVLSDSRGQTMVRRVLSTAELGSDRATLPPHGELPLQATMDLGKRRIAGYTIELFYP
jgi:predicted Zn finger-like uncharacterized protein